jgi:hypothetical protein
MKKRTSLVTCGMNLVMFFVIVGSSPSTVLAQCCPMPSKASASRDPSRPPVFCPVKSAGQLCDHGTAAILSLKGEKRAQWYKMVEEYNRTVQSAQNRFVEQARKVLQPAELAQVQKWFAARQNAARKLASETPPSR